MSTAAYDRALDELRALADDFSEGSQQRWMLQLRKTSDLRDALWLLEHDDRPDESLTDFLESDPR